MTESPVFGHETSYRDYLGQVEFNSTGHVVKAKSVRSIWIEQFDPDRITIQQELTGFQAWPVDPLTWMYENELLKVLDMWRNERVTERRGYSLNMNLGLRVID